MPWGSRPASVTGVDPVTAPEPGPSDRVGAAAGLMLNTDSSVPASMDSATQLAISGRIAPC